MSAETELRPPPRRPLPDLEAEEEVDLGRYWRAVLLRWWLPLAGLGIGIVLGYLAALGSGDVYQAKATVYLGQPLSTSGAPVQSLATNPSFVRQTINSEFVIRQAARRAGLRPSQVRGHVSTQTVSAGATPATRVGVNPLVTISVTGPRPRKVGQAANALADLVVAQVNAYPLGKITSFRTQLASYTSELAAINAQKARIEAKLSGRSLSSTDKLVLGTQLSLQEQERRQVVDEQQLVQQQLSIAQNIESARVIAGAVPVKSTARSRRNAVLVGAAIGLILGLAAALLWDPALSAFRRRL
jgi:uncharacterized protein involved in exopolysaccharide biosynthesis